MELILGRRGGEARWRGNGGFRSIDPRFGFDIGGAVRDIFDKVATEDAIEL
jgi:hypothetical protein